MNCCRAGSTSMTNARVGVVGRETFGDRRLAVLGLDVVERPDLEYATEPALEVRPEETQCASGDFREPDREACGQRASQ